jgi:hypothetical protein
MRTLAGVLLAVGVLFGAVEVGVAAAADAMGAPPPPARCRAGSLAGGLLADHAGPAAAFATAAAAGGLAVLGTVARSRTLPAVVTPQPATV